MLRLFANISPQWRWSSDVSTAYSWLHHQLMQNQLITDKTITLLYDLCAGKIQLQQNDSHLPYAYWGTCMEFTLFLSNRCECWAALHLHTVELYIVIVGTLLLRRWRPDIAALLPVAPPGAEECGHYWYSICEHQQHHGSYWHSSNTSSTAAVTGTVYSKHQQQCSDNSLSCFYQIDVCACIVSMYNYKYN